MNKPPHKTGDVRAKTVARVSGATWWGQRWIEALEHSSRDVVNRLGRGRAYARDGHVHDLQIKSGKVLATVSDDELDSYRVSLQLEVFSAEVWQQVLKVMAEQALFAAQLLNGEMPREIDRLFRSCGKSLFPQSSHDIDADCSCEDWSSPCKHVAATHYVLGDALDRDPFLLFELRGRGKEQVLAALSQLRSGSARVVTQQGAEIAAAQSGGVPLRELSVDHFEQPETELNVGSFNFDAQAASGALLRSLGRPSSWMISESPQDLLGPVVAQARQLAMDLAISAGEAGAEINRFSHLTAKTASGRKRKIHKRSN